MEFENNAIVDNSFNDTGVEGDNDTSTTDTGVDETEGADESTTEEGTEKVVDSQKQTSKQDKAFADMRRRLEAAEAEAKQFRELNNRATAMFKEHGVKDLNEYFDKLETQLYEDKKAQLEAKGYDPDTIDEILQKDKENITLQKEVEQLKQKQYAIQLTEAYKLLNKEYPDLVKSPDDISDEVWAKIDRGYDMLDAFESVNRTAIKNRSAEAAKQKTLNNLSSKKHLKTEGDGAGDGTATVIDQDVLQNYIDMGFSKKDAIAHYKRLYG